MKALKHLFFATILMYSINGKAQVFYPESGGLILYADTTKEVKQGTDAYSDCWCYPVYTDSSENSVKYLIPKHGTEQQISVKKNGKWGVIGKDGSKKLDFVYGGPVIPLKNGQAVFHYTSPKSYTEFVNPKTKLVVKDSTGQLVDSLWVQDEYKGHFLVSKDGRYYGIIDGKSNIKLALEYRPMVYTKERFFFNPNGYFTCKKEYGPDDVRAGIVNYKGQIIVPMKYDYMGDYIVNEDAIFAQINDRRGYINIKGQVVLALQFKELPYDLADTNLVMTESYTWWMDRNFNVIDGQKYQKLEWKKDRYFFKQNGLWGVMDAQKKIIVPRVYTTIMDGPRIQGNNDFKCYIVRKGDKYGVITRENEIIIPIEYDCLCGLSYFAPASYYIEFTKAGVSYKFKENGELVEKGKASGKPCLCDL